MPLVMFLEVFFSFIRISAEPESVGLRMDRMWHFVAPVILFFSNLLHESNALLACSALFYIVLQRNCMYSVQCISLLHNSNLRWRGVTVGENFFKSIFNFKPHRETQPQLPSMSMRLVLLLLLLPLIAFLPLTGFFFLFKHQIVIVNVVLQCRI